MMTFYDSHVLKNKKHLYVFFYVFYDRIIFMNNLYIVAFILGILTLAWILWKWNNRAILITHSGNFHPDEIFSTAVIVELLKRKGKFFQVIRTRDNNIFEKYREERKKGKEVYIYDVGLMYDEEKNEFDHHQKGGAGQRKNGIEYSSAGLVWKKFGEEFTGSKETAWKIEKKLVLSIDALDNGQEIYENKYDFFRYDLHNLISLFKPNKKSNFKMKIGFCRSVKLIQFILKKEIIRINKLVSDEKKVTQIYNDSGDKRVLTFYDSVSTSSITDNYPDVLFTITKKEKNVWVIETIVEKWGSFDRRKYFPKSWSGLNNYDLDNITGVVGGIFCHKNVFISSAKSEQAANEMVKVALKNNDN